MRISQPLEIGLTPEAVANAVALLLANAARREHRHPEMRPQTSLKQGKSTALGAVTASPRPANGHPKGKGAGVTLLRGQGSAGPSPTPPRCRHGSSPTSLLPAGFWVLKFLGRVDVGGCFLPGSPRDAKNGMNNILGLVSGALVKHRGAYGTQLRLRVLHLWLCVPLFGRGQGAGRRGGPVHPGLGARVQVQGAQPGQGSHGKRQ